MKTRRSFVKLVAAAGAVGAGSPAIVRSFAAEPDDVRATWCRIAGRLAAPMLPMLAARRLKATMPVEAARGPRDRQPYTHLEALGRLLCGLAPWFELGADASPEGVERARLTALAREAIDAASDPTSPDFMNFNKGQQPLVDCAFLAQAFLRAPNELWQKLSPRVQSNVVTALKSSRRIQPGENNWKLFAAEIEVFLHRIGETRDEARIENALSKFQTWYLGDGMYGDGPEFHWDYYNAFVIQPMLFDVLAVVGDESESRRTFREKVQARLTRFAAIEERLIAPDGTYPAIGRSIAYRCGAFQGLALAALRHRLPPALKPAQARTALTAVIRRTLDAPGTFDEQGWLRIGLSGHQPALGETYISTGSLYLCSAALLPLGLPTSDPFWADPAIPSSWSRVWSGENLPADHALK